MKKTFFSVLAFVFCQSLAVANTSAEETTEEQAKLQQQIVDVKMSRKVIYADSYEGKLILDKARLRQRNQKKLEYMIRAFLVQDLGLSAEDAQELYDFVDDKLQNVERTIDGATVAHLFSFITKESLVSLVKKNNYDFSGLADYIANPENYEIDDKLQQSLDELSHHAIFDENNIVEKKIETEIIDDTKDVDIKTVTIDDTKDVDIKTVIIDDRNDEDIKTVVNNKEKEVVVPVPPIKPALVEELFACGNFGDVTKYLVNKKKNNEVEWGNARTMAAKVDQCYVVVIDRNSKEVITVLGIGKDTRINYQTGAQCSDTEFGDASRIYVQPLK